MAVLGVHISNSRKLVERLADRNESVTGVNEAGVWQAGSAEVPIWAIEALVANAEDVLKMISLDISRWFNQHTLSQPSQIALWPTLRPGASSF